MKTAFKAVGLFVLYTTALSAPHSAESKRSEEGLARDEIAYAGIGVTLDFADGVVIAQVFDGSPSANAGLRAGDRIVAITEKFSSPPIPVQGMRSEEIINRLRGPADTAVILRVEREGKMKSYVVVRSQILASLQEVQKLHRAEVERHNQIWEQLRQPKELAERGEAVVPDLIRILEFTLEHPNSEARNGALATIQHMGPPARATITLLIQHAKDAGAKDDRSLERETALALVAIGADAVEPIVFAIRQSHNVPQYGLILALSQIRPVRGETFMALQEFLRNSTAPEIRRAVISAIGNAGAARPDLTDLVLPDLVGELKSTSVPLQRETMLALGKIKKVPNEAINKLIELSLSPEPSTAHLAVLSLEAIGTPEANNAARTRRRTEIFSKQNRHRILLNAALAVLTSMGVLLTLECLILILRRQTSRIKEIHKLVARIAWLNLTLCGAMAIGFMFLAYMRPSAVTPYGLIYSTHSEFHLTEIR